MTETNVLYIAGWGRSGSTLLGAILGQYPRCFFAGELAWIWRHGFLENIPCGCGAPFGDCPVWSAIALEAYGTLSPGFAREMASHVATGVRSLDILTGSRRQSDDANVAAYRERTAALYRAISEVTGCETVVDSSKTPGYAFELRQIRGVRPAIVHLVRDPRATSYSWQQRVVTVEREGTTRTQERFSIARSAAEWLKWNLAIETLAKVRGLPSERVYYEDFSRAPRTIVEGLMGSLAPSSLGLNSPFLAETQVRLEPTHTVWGNPSRTKTGVVEIRRDDRWKSKMSRRDKLAVAAITAALARAYGYRLLS